jgi:hypothetical protein
MSDTGEEKIKEERRKVKEYQKKFWKEFEPIDSPNKKEIRKIIEYESEVPDEIPQLQEYLNGISRQYAKIRATDVFKPYILLIVIVGAISFAVAFVVGYNLEVDSDIFPNLLYANRTQNTSENTVTRGNFEFAFILATSAAASAGIAFAALGSNAVQNQTDRLFGLSYQMDQITNRIAAKELQQFRGRGESNASQAESGKPDVPPPPNSLTLAPIKHYVTIPTVQYGQIPTGMTAIVVPLSDTISVSFTEQLKKGKESEQSKGKA